MGGRTGAQSYRVDLPDPRVWQGRGQANPAARVCQWLVWFFEKRFHFWVSLVVVEIPPAPLLQRGEWSIRALRLPVACRPFIVPTLQRGNAALTAPAVGDAERRGIRSHAGAWERSYRHPGRYDGVYLYGRPAGRPYISPSRFWMLSMIAWKLVLPGLSASSLCQCRRSACHSSRVLGGLGLVGG